MKKRSFILLLTIGLLLGLAACGGTAANSEAAPTASSAAASTDPSNSAAASTEPTSSAPETGAPTAGTGKTVEPLPATLSMNALNDHSFAASFKASDVRLNEDGALVITMKVCDCELFDLGDIARLAQGDTLRINSKDVLVQSIEQNGKNIVINGGPKQGGYNLYTDNESVYCETDADGNIQYYALGEVTLPVDQDFVFIDNSDPQNLNAKSYAGDFLIAMENSKDEFQADTTTVSVSGGKVIELTRTETP